MYFFQKVEWFIRASPVSPMMKVKRRLTCTFREYSNNSNGNLQMRLGIKGHSTVDDGRICEFQQFIEANWLYSSHTHGMTMNGE